MAAIDTKPIPDPTSLTTQQLNHEIQSLKDLNDARRADIDNKINHERELQEQQFKTISREIAGLQLLLESKLAELQRLGNSHAERDVLVHDRLTAELSDITSNIQTNKVMLADLAILQRSDIENVERLISVARDESRSRFDSFQATHVKNHEREHEMEHQAAVLAMDNMNRRLEGMNEFRAQIASTEAKYATKAEVIAIESKIEGKLVANSERIRTIEETRVNLSSKDDLKTHSAANDKQIDALTERFRQHESNAGLFFSKAEHEVYSKGVDSDIRLLRESRAELQGKASQSQMNITLIISMISLLLSSAGFFIKLFVK